MTSNADSRCYAKLDWHCKNVEPIISSYSYIVTNPFLIPIESYSLIGKAHDKNIISVREHFTLKKPSKNLTNANNDPILRLSLTF